MITFTKIKFSTKFRIIDVRRNKNCSKTTAKMRLLTLFLALLIAILPDICFLRVPKPPAIDRFLMINIAKSIKMLKL